MIMGPDPAMFNWRINPHRIALATQQANPGELSAE
jgi:hypothetical protein